MLGSEIARAKGEDDTIYLIHERLTGPARHVDLDMDAQLAAAAHDLIGQIFFNVCLWGFGTLVLGIIVTVIL